jgi:hypothetical protein
MIVCGYYTLFFVGSYRETIGTMLFGLRVLSANIVKMDYTKVFVRNRTNLALNNLVIVSVQPYRGLYKGRRPTPKSYGNIEGMVAVTAYRYSYYRLV